jgi:hypothetical protein
MMRIRTIFFINVAVLFGVAVLISGCAGKKCRTDSDCGGYFCSENLTKAVSPTCVKGRCQDITTECSDTKICVADSLGANCLAKDPVTNKAFMSCDNNTDNTNILGFNQFNTEGYTCTDDCPKDHFCNEACNCEKMEELSCSWSTAAHKQSGINPFNQRTNICTDDCPGVFNCNNQCLCEQRPRDQCPDPVFTNNYFDPPPVEFELEEIYAALFPDPFQLLYLEEIHIPAYEHHRDGNIYYIPFPEYQLVLVLNPFNELIHEEGWEGYCVNDYYDGEGAMDIENVWLARPIQGCVWGGTEGFEGVLTVCPEDLIDWFTAFVLKRGPISY